MFGWISKSVYEKASKRISELESALKKEELTSNALRNLWYRAANESEKLADSLSALKYSRQANQGSTQFTQDELRSLLQLVHPDKHGGKASAVTMTQKINKLRS